MLQSRNTRAQIYIVDTIEYDVKSTQVKLTIVKRTKIRVKLLTVNRSQKNRWRDQRFCQENEVHPRC